MQKKKTQTFQPSCLSWKKLVAQLSHPFHIGTWSLSLSCLPLLTTQFVFMKHCLPSHCLLSFEGRRHGLYHYCFQSSAQCHRQPCVCLVEWVPCCSVSFTAPFYHLLLFYGSSLLGKCSLLAMLFQSKLEKRALTSRASRFSWGKEKTQIANVSHWVNHCLTRGHYDSMGDPGDPCICRNDLCFWRHCRKRVDELKRYHGLGINWGIFRPQKTNQKYGKHLVENRSMTSVLEFPGCAS